MRPAKDASGAAAGRLDSWDRRRWSALAALAALVGAWSAAAGFRVDPEQLGAVASTAAVLGSLAVVVRLLARVPRLRAAAERLHYPAAASALHAATLLFCFSFALEWLLYLGSALALPWRTDWLHRADAALGFHWPTAFAWMRERPFLQRTLECAYRSGLAQLNIVPVVLAVSGRRERLGELVDHFVAAAFICVAAATLVPTMNGPRYYGVSELGLPATTHLFALRSGELRELPLLRLQGLITFPSFHTAMGVALAWALRDYRVLFPIAIAVNALMIASTPTEGGHFLVDVPGGLAVAWLVIRGRAALARGRAR